jgi:hypothetical protein
MSKDPGELPTYDEVTKLGYQVTAARAEHTRRIGDEKICPSIRRRADDGLSKTTIILIPSNLDMAKTTDAIEIVDFHGHEEEVEQVQLEGNLNRLEFWKQPDVIKELRYVLEERLSASPIPRDFGQKTTPVQEIAPPAVGTQKRKGLFDRRPSKQATDENIANPDPSSSSKVPSNRIDVKVALEDICIRTVSDFGLYETVTQPVVVVTVDING